MGPSNSKESDSIILHGCEKHYKGRYNRWRWKDWETVKCVHVETKVQLAHDFGGCVSSLKVIPFGITNYAMSLL